MSLLFRGLSFPNADGLLAERTGKRTAARSVSLDEANRHSVVWACLRLRADLVSSSPVDTYREVSGRAVEVPKPPVLVSPGGSKVGMKEWLYSTQVDLDSCGNTFGIITARDGLGFPSRIDLVAAETVVVRTKAGQITEYKVGQTTYDPSMIWHEKQYTRAGLPVGLSPIANAALPLSVGLSAQQFAADWFDGSAVPASHLKNTAKTLDDDQAKAVKARFKASVSNGDVFVTGNDWDYAMLGAKASEAGAIEAQHSSSTDLCRYLGAPADIVDVASDGTASITYANITQRNLQLLIMNLGPAIGRREDALSAGLLPRPRYVKLNTDAVVLRMDPKSRAEMNALLLSSKQRTPSEVREKDDLPPFTPEQIAEINALAGAAAQPAPVTKEYA